MDAAQLPELSAAERYTSLFIQEDEPLDNLRPKKTNPFEECSSSSSSDSETGTPRPPPVQINTDKRPLIITCPTWGNQYKPPTSPTTKQRTPIQTKQRADDIRRAGAVLDAAFSRHATSQHHRPAANPPPPLTVASTLTSESGEYTTPPADVPKARTASRTLSPNYDIVVSHCKRPQSSRRPQMLGDTAAHPRTLQRSISRSETPATTTESTRVEGEVMGAASALLSLYNGEGGGW